MAETISNFLVSDCPADTVEGILVTAGADTEYNGVLRVVNLDASKHTYSIWHCPVTGTGADSSYLAKDQFVPGNTTVEWSINLGKSHELRRKSGLANNITFHYSGRKKVTS